MARKKGRDISGWLVVDKPTGPGSTQVVAAVRRALGAKKAGHAGTLDPAASGLLAVALGEATKTVPFVTDGEKLYRFTVRWGQATNTDDAEGEVIAERAGRPDEEAIRAALPAFTGDIRQVPPKFSAVKVAGERAYALARDDEEFELAARDLHVARLELVAMPDADHAEFEMVCGKGGYVRSIARDLGEALGCLGHVTALRRLAAGPFSLEDAVTLDEVAALGEAGGLEARLMPLEDALADLPELRATPAGAARLRNGNPGQVLNAPPEGHGAAAWASEGGKALAVGVYRAGELHPNRVFLADGR